MIDSFPLLLVTLAQQELVSNLQNFLAKTARALVRLGSGHETLIIVIMILLLLMYLYIRKA